MKIKHILIALLLPLLFASCEKSNIATADYNGVVVNAFLRAEDSISLKLNREFIIDSDDSTYEPVNNVAVKVTCDNIAHQLSFNGEGKYSSPLIVQAGKTYYLSFTYYNKQVTAQTTVPTKPEGFTGAVDSIHGVVKWTVVDTTYYAKYTWNNPSDLYHYLSIECLDGKTSPINLNNSVSVIRYLEPIKTTTYSLSDKSFSYYGLHRIVLFKIPDEYAKLYQHYSTNAESLTSPPTNVTNGLGIFTSYSTDTLYLKVYK
ncbi:DUF4249 family protein [Parabacteroides sp. FAFU027]|uniref:DUF4249 family protein n=1 Tax=Parabacteroides sp. FAFU027 TaxID=2922715 RepID=UPI001FAF0F33|nr:DUF4249 family protein [Parabacteroides sp. FAFU027]